MNTFTDNLLRVLTVGSAAALIIGLLAVGITRAHADDTVLVPPTPVVQLADKSGPFCTAFLVAPSYLVTAGHCVFPTPNLKHPDTRDYTKLTVIPVDAASIDLVPLPVRVVASSSPYDGLADWALLKLNLPIQDWKPELLDCKYVPVIGDNITYQGFPGAQNGYMVNERGYINTAPQTNAAEQTPNYGATMPVSGGASGSPANYNGKTFGIVVAQNPAQTAWSYIQPITQVCAVLKEILDGN